MHGRKFPGISASGGSAALHILSTSGVPSLGSVLGPKSQRGPLGYHVLPWLLTVALAYV